MSDHIEAYRRKRDRVVTGLGQAGYRVTKPGGAFYVFPEVPQNTGQASGTRESASEFVARAIQNELLIIPSNIFSERGTHFRISYAASDETIERGLAVLVRAEQVRNTRKALRPARIAVLITKAQCLWVCFADGLS